jgi:hypothetical protein
MRIARAGLQSPTDPVTLPLFPKANLSFHKIESHAPLT